MLRGAVLCVFFSVGCSGPHAAMVEPDLSTVGDAENAPPDAAAPDLSTTIDLAPVAVDAAVDAARPECEWGGAPGTCITLTACAAIADHSSEPGSCPGPATIQCCIDSPNVADNPPTPAGWKLMTQAQVTPAMTTWVVTILHDPVTYPMYSTTMMTFPTLLVLARVEWHPPDFQNSVVHRGVTLYQPK